MKPELVIATTDNGMAGRLRHEIRQMCKVTHVKTLAGVIKTLRREPAAVLFDVETLTGPRIEWRHVGWHLVKSKTTAICAVERRFDCDLVSSLSPSRWIDRGIHQLMAFFKEFFDPDATHKLRDVRYEPCEDVFVGEFFDRRVCEAPRRSIEADDGTDIVKVVVEPERYGFLVEQRSGNAYDVAADFLRYHGDPGYAYYKGRAEGFEEERAGAERIGARVRALREAAGLSQAALAERTNIQRPNVSRIESGKHVPSLETLERIARAFGVRVAELVQ